METMESNSFSAQPFSLLQGKKMEIFNKKILPKLPLLVFPLASLGFIWCSSVSEKMEKIPLNTIYGVKGGGLIKEINDIDEEVLLAFVKLRPQASNLFLVSGKLSEAAKAAVHLRATDKVSLPKEKGDQMWLVVFFGFSRSTPVQWTVDSVERGQSVIRVKYSLPGPPFTALTADFIPYFVFVPLGDQKPGKYILQLFDSGTQEVTLMRRVEIIGLN